MASSPNFVAHVLEKLQGAGEILSKKMFGEYGLYLNGTFFACIADDQLFIKITDAGRALMPLMPTAPPYKGASEYFLVENLDDGLQLSAFCRATANALPVKKPRKAKK